jgi:hypothetical protein
MLAVVRVFAFLFQYVAFLTFITSETFSRKNNLTVYYYTLCKQVKYVIKQ